MAFNLIAPYLSVLLPELLSQHPGAGMRVGEPAPLGTRGCLLCRCSQLWHFSLPALSVAFFLL